MNPETFKIIQELFGQAKQYEAEGKIACARAIYHRILAKVNYEEITHNALANSYAETFENPAALNHAQMAFMINPVSPTNRWVYGLMLYRTSEWQKAIEVLTPLTISNPDWPNLNLVLAKLYLEIRDMSKSDPFFVKATKNVEGNHLEEGKVRWEHAMQQLTQSNYKEGWHNHEARLISIGWAGLNLCPLPAPVWQNEPLAGKTIVVHGEQGLGDEIMYASMIPDLIERGAQVIFACHPALQNVMKLSFPSIKVVSHPRGDAEIQNWSQGIMPAWWTELLQQNVKIDYQIPTGSLAHILRTGIKDFPRTPYLKIATEQQTAHKNLLSKRAKEQKIALQGKKLIGLAWCGNLANPHGRAKSLDLNQLTQLGQIAREHNAVFVSLQSQQYGYQALDALAEGFPIIDMSPYTAEFDATLAVASLCDHIISIDTSYVHLCGAAGLNTLLLLRRNCDWRWGWIKDESDWYNSLELIRQDADLDWTPVIKKTEQKLLKWLTTP